MSQENVEIARRLFERGELAAAGELIDDSIALTLAAIMRRDDASQPGQLYSRAVPTLFPP